ncbi:MAG: hypothetical protein PHO64_05420, partial [Thiomonas sp.]|nr:hypothetical protein [Thiomonas sp.]
MDEIMGNKVLNTEKKKDTPFKLKRKLPIKASIITALVQLSIVGGVLAVWQWGVQVGIISNFLVGSPAGIFEKMWQVMLDGSLWTDTKATLLEAIIGFLIGSLVGSVVGLSLWYSP